MLDSYKGIRYNIAEGNDNNKLISKEDTMNIALYENNIMDIKALESEVRALNEKIEKLKDELKADMIANGLDKVDTCIGVVRYTDVVSNRFDTTSFKKASPELYSKYLVESVSKRFTIK